MVESDSPIDRTTAPSTAYSYTVAALEAAGNLSAQSGAANVTTPAGTPPTDTTPQIDPGGVALTVLGAPMSFAGDFHSHAAGGLINHAADWLHDRGVSFSATSACALA